MSAQSQLLKDGIQKSITSLKRKELYSKFTNTNTSNPSYLQIQDSSEDTQYKNEEVEIDCETKHLMKHVQELEHIILFSSKNLVDMKNKEIERVSKEFITNNYGRNFNTTIETVISSIVGKSNLKMELEKFNLIKKSYTEATSLVHNFC